MVEGWNKWDLFSLIFTCCGINLIATISFPLRERVLAYEVFSISLSVNVPSCLASIGFTSLLCSVTW